GLARQTGLESVAIEVARLDPGDTLSGEQGLARRLGPIFEQGDEDVARFHGGDCFRSEVGPHCRQREVGEVGDCRSAAQALSGEFPAATDLALPPGGQIDRQTRRFEPHPIVLHPRARAETTTNSVATVFATGVAAAAIARLKLVR